MRNTSGETNKDVENRAIRQFRRATSQPTTGRNVRSTNDGRGSEESSRRAAQERESLEPIDPSPFRRHPRSKSNTPGARAGKAKTLNEALVELDSFARGGLNGLSFGAYDAIGGNDYARGIAGHIPGLSGLYGGYVAQEDRDQRASDVGNLAGVAASFLIPTGGLKVVGSKAASKLKPKRLPRMEFPAGHFPQIDDTTRASLPLLAAARRSAEAEAERAAIAAAHTTPIPVATVRHPWEMPELPIPVSWRGFTSGGAR